MLNRVRSSFCMATLVALTCVTGCKRESGSDKPATLESDLVHKESLEAPSTPSSPPPKVAEPEVSQPKETAAVPAAATEDSEATRNAAPEMKPEPAPTSTPKLSLAEVTPVQAERAMREALKLAAQNTTTKLGAKGGLTGASDARIPLPEEWRSMEIAIRKVNRGESVDALQGILNAAAERAVADLGAKLDDLIVEVDLGDAKKALTSSADGATQALLAWGEDRIQSSAREAVAKSLAGTGADSALAAALKDARFANPFTNIKNVEGFDLTAYLGDQLAQRVLVGMAGEERTLRENPDLIESEKTAAIFEAAR